jgi:hypothetical protein
MVQERFLSLYRENDESGNGFFAALVMGAPAAATAGTAWCMFANVFSHCCVLK